MLIAETEPEEDCWPVVHGPGCQKADGSGGFLSTSIMIHGQASSFKLQSSFGRLS